MSKTIIYTEEASGNIGRWFKVWGLNSKEKNIGLKQLFLWGTRQGGELGSPEVWGGSIFQVSCGVDLADFLLAGMDEIACYHRNQPWTTFSDVSILTSLACGTSLGRRPGDACVDVSRQSLNATDAGDLLDALIAQSEPPSTVASPLWSPCTTDSGINDDPLIDPTDAFPSSFCAALPTLDTPFFPPPLESQPPPAEKNPYVSRDLGKLFCFFLRKKGKIIQCCPISLSDWALSGLRSFLNGKPFVSICEGHIVVPLSCVAFFVFHCVITARKPPLVFKLSVQQHKGTPKVCCVFCIAFCFLSRVFFLFK